MDKETRVFAIEDLEVRDDNGKISFRGYAAVFNALSEDLGGFREQIAPGAFKKTIRESDIRLLVNHDPNLVLARNRAGTLKLSEDDRGLMVKAEIAPTTYGRDLAVSLERGDVSQMSFGFRTVKDEWSTVDGGQLRTLKEARLFDVSAVTFPAYPQTSAELAGDLGRALALAGVEVRDYLGALEVMRQGGSATEDLLEIVQRAAGALVETLPAERRQALAELLHPQGSQAGDSEAGSSTSETNHSIPLAVARARLELASRELLIA